MLQPGDKKALTILAAAIAAVLVVTSGLTFALVRGSEEPMPTVSVSAGDRLVRAEPGFWCDADMSACRPSNPRVTGVVPDRVYRVPAPVGRRVLVSVPHQVAEGPWAVIAQWATPMGVQREISIKRRNSVYTLELFSEPDRVLLGLEVWSVSTAFVDAPDGFNSPDGDILMRGMFRIDASPEGFVLENATELPDTRADA